MSHPSHWLSDPPQSCTRLRITSRCCYTLLAACTTISTSEVPTRMVCSIEGSAAISSYALQRNSAVHIYRKNKTAQRTLRYTTTLWW
jgi:hypothetical protein